MAIIGNELNARRRHYKHVSPNDSIWPKGTRQKFSRRAAKRFFDALSESHVPLLEVLRAHPELPPYGQLQSWRAQHPEFQEGWRKAREQQGEFLVQKCLHLADTTTPKNAHQKRVQFDIYWKVAAKFYPSVYGDKPAQPVTNVNVGVSISTERLNEIRSKLDVTRAEMLSKPENKATDTKDTNDTKSLPLLIDSHTNANRNH